MEPFFAEWLEFLKLLTRHRVRFLLIGGHAIAVHAQPRYTADLDILVAATRENARRIRAALVDFGYGSVAPTLAALTTRDKVFMLGRVPFRIDILTGIDGVTFDECWATRVPLEIEGVRIFVIGREALIANRRGRTPKGPLRRHPPRRPKPHDEGRRDAYDEGGARDAQATLTTLSSSAQRRPAGRLASK